MDYFYGFTDYVNHHTIKCVSTDWILYSQDHDLVSSGGFFLGLATNNIVEYHTVIGLLTKSSSRDVDHMVVNLDS